jgi:hypothetical protein
MSTVSVEIKGKDNLSPAVHKARSSMDSLKGSAHNLVNALNPMMIVGAGVALAVTKITSTVTKLVKEFGESERMAIQLQTALGGSAGAFDRMSAMIDQMATKTMGSKDELEALVGQMASLGKSEAEIEKITAATIALSNVTGQSLDAAYKAINGTFVGTTKELKKLVPEIGDLTKEQLAAGGAVDILNRKLGDISDAMASGVSQKVKNLSDSFGDLRENIGEQMLTAFTPMLGFIQSVVTEWNNAYDAHKKYQEALTGDPVLAAMLLKVHTLEGKMGELRAYGITGELQKTIGEQLSAAQRTLKEYEKAKAAKAESILPSSTATTSTVSPGVKAAAPTIAPVGDEEAAWLRFIDQYSVGWREVDAGIDDVIASMDVHAGAVDAVVPKLSMMAQASAQFKSGWDTAINDIAAQWKGFDHLVSSTIILISQGMASALQSVGTALYNQTLGWDTLGASALNVLAQILNSIGAQLAGLAAFHLLIGDFAGAGLAAVASGAAFVAAGVAAAWAADISSAPSTATPGATPGGTPYATTGTTATTGASASYSRARDITVNVSVETTALVGDGGMRDFAMMIWREINAAGVLGAA